MSRYVVWGAGRRGEKIFNLLGKQSIAAFIDSNPSKHGKFFLDKPVINFDNYEEMYSTKTIIISIRESEIIEQFLKERNFYNYLYFDNTDQDYFNYLKYSLLKYRKTDKIGVYGVNFLGIMILDFLHDSGYENIGVVGEIKNKYNSFTHRFKFWQEHESLDYIIVTNDCASKIASKYRNVQVDDLHDRAYKMSKYHNLELQKFKNIHSGQRCFIVGNGPSLTFDDLDCLYRNDEITFGVNQVYRSFPNVHWRPDYFFVGDKMVLESYGEEIKNLDLPCFFISDSNENFWNDFSDKRFYLYHHINRLDKEAFPPFSDDISNGIGGLGTIVYECIQCAIYMGFKEIYLLGIDSNYSKNDVANYFVKNYHDSTKPDGHSPFAVSMHFLAYQAARYYAEQHGVKIFNATRGGKLEVFERVDFDSLFLNGVIKLWSNETNCSTFLGGGQLIKTLSASA